MAEVALRYGQAVEELDSIEPLWNALHEHHAQITPNLGSHTPKRDVADAWRVRRQKYERWLESPETFFVVAEGDGGPVGYAFVTVGLGYASWDTGERIAALETLSVLADHRSEGIGSALLDAVWERLGRLGIDSLTLTVAGDNADAQRFYEREGFQQRFVVYHGERQSRR